MTNIFANMDTQPKGIYKETDVALYTNNHNFPAYMADKLIEYSESSYSGERSPTNVSASMFSKSIKQIILELDKAENPYKLTIDVSSLVASTHGTLFHTHYLEAEEPRAFMELCGFTVSGESDRIEVDPATGGKTLRDIKSTSSFMLKKLMADMEVHVPGRSLADMKVHTPVLFKYAIQQSIYNVLYKLGLTTATLDFIIINHSPLDRSTIGEALQGYVIPIATEEDTVAFMIDILTKVKQYRTSGYLPNCTETETSGKPQPLFKLVKNPAKPRKVNGSGDYRSRTEAAQAMSQYPGTVVFDATQFAKPDLCTKYCQFCNVTNHLGETVCTQGTDLYNREN